VNKAFLGVDYGRKRIGLAVSEAGLIARPLKTIENKGERKNLAAFAEVVKGYNIGTIVVGLPLHRNTAMADEVKVFGNFMAQQLGVRVEFQNEMLSSVEAEESVRLGLDCHVALRTPRNDNKKVIDSIAASMILQDYLQNKGEK